MSRNELIYKAETHRVTKGKVSGGRDELGV